MWYDSAEVQAIVAFVRWLREEHGITPGGPPEKRTNLVSDEASDVAELVYNDLPHMLEFEEQWDTLRLDEAYRTRAAHFVQIEVIRLEKRRRQLAELPEAPGATP
ncbi:hypothetical protein HZA26_02610 [Candidatus Nomurabacteria bacterium]|nr:hypothetical protein [Candidatus Nomurabacteria bacterium]